MDVVDFGQAVRTFRERAGLKQAELAERVGVTGPYISFIETGKRPPPKDEVTVKIEAALDLAPNALVRLAHIARTPEDIRRETDLDRLYAEGKLGGRPSAGDEEGVRLKLIPLINKVAAGYPADFTDLDYPAGVADDYVSVPDLDDANAFAIAVCGDSMSPRFNEGDILIISPAAEVAGGDFCFVRINRHGETMGTFKQAFFDDEHTVRLVSLNNRYPPQLYDRESLSGLFKAVRRLEML